MKSKIIAIFLSVLTIISMFCVSASAATSASVELTTDDRWVYSDPISAKAATATVYNAASSKYKVYGMIQYESGSKYVTDVQFIVDKGDTEKEESSSSFSKARNWQLQLNPYGVATKNCTAEGTIKSA